MFVSNCTWNQITRWQGCCHLVIVRDTRGHIVHLLIKRPAASCCRFNPDQLSLYPTWPANQPFLCFVSPLLKNVEDDHLNDSLGNPGLISPDKEDLSRLLVWKMHHHLLNHICIYQLAPSCVLNSVHFCADGALQRTNPGRHAAREEDHRDGHRRPGARQVGSLNYACTHALSAACFCRTTAKDIFVFQAHAGRF